MSNNQVTIQISKKHLALGGLILLLILAVMILFSTGAIKGLLSNNSANGENVSTQTFEGLILAASDPDETGIPLIMVDDPKQIDLPLVGLISIEGHEELILAVADPNYEGNDTWFKDPILSVEDPSLAVGTPLIGLINLDQYKNPILAIASPDQFTLALAGLAYSNDGPILAILNPEFVEAPILAITKPYEIEVVLVSTTYTEQPKLVFHIPDVFGDPIIAFDSMVVEENEPGPPHPQINLDASTFFENPFFFEDTFFMDPTPATLLTTSRIYENTVMYTFEAQEALPGAEYTANITLPNGTTVNYQCDTLEEYPDRVYCYGPVLKSDIELSVMLFASDPEYNLANIISPELLDAHADNIGIDWEPYNTAAENMGLDYKIDNPFEAWNVIGCCVMNSEGALPSGCEALPVGNNNVPDFLGVDQINGEGAADAIWNLMLENALSPSDWEPEYNGEKIDEDELLAKANTCASAFDGGNISSIGEAREFYNVVRHFDTRVDYDRSWGAEFADSITGFFDTYFSWLVDPDYWSDTWADLKSFNLSKYLTDAGRKLACSGIAAAKFINDDVDYPSWCPEWDGSYPEYSGTGTDYQPDELFEPLPEACIDYIDYADSETYFFTALTPYAGTSTAQYCLDALNVNPGVSAMVAINQPDALYDALIENFEYIGNPAMPDACKAFTDWCNSDQLGFLENGHTAPLLEGSMFAVNGCNDPDNWQEKTTWSANQDPPDCSNILAAIDSGQSGTLGIYDMLRDAYETGSPYVTNTYCYQVWSDRENFNNTPAGQAKACAEAIQYNRSLETVDDYMKFLTFMGVLGSLHQDDYAANYPGCQAALDWAYWLGLTQQGINAAGASCDEGGPTLITQPFTFFNPQTYFEQAKPSLGNGGGGPVNTCATPQPCPAGFFWSIYECTCTSY